MITNVSLLCNSFISFLYQGQVSVVFSESLNAIALDSFLNKGTLYCHLNVV